MSNIIGQGKQTMFLLFVLFAVLTYYYLYKAIRGGKFGLRLMPQVEAIADGIDKSVETGMPVYMTPGNLAALSGTYAAMCLAGMNVLRYVARLCARKGARLIMWVPTNPEVMPLMDGIYRESCVAEGHPEMYRREDVVYSGATENAFGIGLLTATTRTGAACFVVVGACSGGAEMFSMGSVRVAGGTIIGGTARWYHQGTFAVLAHYPMFMEDIYAAGAYCSDDEAAKASYYGGDIIKLVMLGLLVLSAVLAAAGQPIAKWLTM